MDELVKRLREDKSWVEQGTTETEHEISEHIQQAADAIEELQDALLLMVLQYCTTDDGLLYHSFMVAGENAFAVLGVKNGQQADLLWNRMLNKEPPKEE